VAARTGPGGYLLVEASTGAILDRFERRQGGAFVDALRAALPPAPAPGI